MKKVSVSALVFYLSVAATAYAADVPQQQPYRPEPVGVAPFDWTGVYLGVMGGYGIASHAAINGIQLTNADLKGGFIGSTLGYNYQIGQFVIGIEDDGAWSGISKTWPIGFGSLQDNILAIGSLTGRAGFAANNFLIYGKSGYAYMLNEISATGPGGFVWERRLHSGWTVGGGLEYGFTNNWSAKAEYMFTQYLATPYLSLNNATITTDVQTVKLGINYRFGWSQPVTARY